MGNVFSGRPRSPCSKPLANNWNRLDVGTLGLKYGRAVNIANDSGVIDYRQVDSQYGELKVQIGYFIRGTCGIEWVPQHIAGVRPWFLCCLCEGRARHLYAHGLDMCCRTCMGLTYRSQRRSKKDRLLDQAHGLRQRYGFEGTDPSEWTRPKHMHRATFERIKARFLDRFEHACCLSVGNFLAGVLKRQGVIDDQINKAREALRGK